MKNDLVQSLILLKDKFNLAVKFKTGINHLKTEKNGSRNNRC